MGNDSAEVLVERALLGEACAWDSLVEKYEKLVWSVIRSFNLNHADSLDAGQLTWLRLVEKLDQVRQPDRISSWLITTARRECLKIIEQQKRGLPADPHHGFAMLADPVDRFQRADVRDDLEKIFQALSTLGDDCRSLLRMVLTDPPATYAQISKALDLPVGTIGPRRQRCLSRLRAAAQV